MEHGEEWLLLGRMDLVVVDHEDERVGAVLLYLLGQLVHDDVLSDQKQQIKNELNKPIQYLFLSYRQTAKSFCTTETH